MIADLEARIAALRARGTRGFSPKKVRAERTRLELSAADYGELVGVSAVTIYNWEQGRSNPRKKQMEQWHAVNGIGKREAWERLGLDGPAVRSGFSPDAIYAERERLELSAADYGELIGVSQLTIYNWEKGRAEPRKALLEKWQAVKGIGKREAWRRLGLME